MAKLISNTTAERLKRLLTQSNPARPSERPTPSRTPKPMSHLLRIRQDGNALLEVFADGPVWEVDGDTVTGLTNAALGTTNWHTVSSAVDGLIWSVLTGVDVEVRYDLPSTYDDAMVIGIVSGGSIRQLHKGAVRRRYNPDLKSIDRTTVSEDPEVDAGLLQVYKWANPPPGGVVEGTDKLLVRLPNIAGEGEGDPASVPEAVYKTVAAIADYLADNCSLSHYTDCNHKHDHSGEHELVPVINHVQLADIAAGANDDDHNGSLITGNFPYVASRGDASRNRMSSGLGDSDGVMSVDVNGRLLKAANGETRAEWDNIGARLEAGAARVVLDTGDSTATMSVDGIGAGSVQAGLTGASIDCGGHNAIVMDAAGDLYGDNWSVKGGAYEFRDLNLRKIITNGVADDAVKMDEGAGITIGEAVYKPIQFEAIDKHGETYRYEALARKVEPT